MPSRPQPTINFARIIRTKPKNCLIEAVQFHNIVEQLRDHTEAQNKQSWMSIPKSWLYSGMLIS